MYLHHWTKSTAQSTSWNPNWLSISLLPLEGAGEPFGLLSIVGQITIMVHELSGIHACKTSYINREIYKNPHDLIHAYKLE